MRRFELRIDPARMHALVQTLGSLRIKLSLFHYAPERSLNVRGGAAKAFVKVTMTHSGIKIVTPQQPDDATARPNAFRLACRPLNKTACFCDLVDFLGRFLGSISSRFLFVGSLPVAGPGGR